MKLTCDEATALCDKNQYNETTLWEKVKLNIHLFLCRKCGLYSKQNHIVTKCVKIHKDSKLIKNDSLSEEEKEHIKEELKIKINQ